MWRNQFDLVYRAMDLAVDTLTAHPDLAGRPQVVVMFERPCGLTVDGDGAGHGLQLATLNLGAGCD